jgi:UDPglucose 6-dehydrogenase
MKVQIIGQDTLAAAVYQCCSMHFDTQPADYRDADVIWMCYDTPLSERGEPDTAWVIEQVGSRLRTLNGPGPMPLILLSSQMPVGTTADLEAQWPGLDFAYSPENIRVATAVADFSNQARIVVGTRRPERRGLLEELFAPFTKLVIFTDPETAEMVKHALNCFLGLQIAFINEIAKIAKSVGADMETITVGLRTDARVSMKAPLKAGGPFGGGHLARDIYTLNRIAEASGMSVPIISHITESNAC